MVSNDNNEVNKPLEQNNDIATEYNDDAAIAECSDSITDSLVCRKCGASITAELQYCPKCGTAVKRICSKCGSVLSDGQDFCPKCGTRYSDGIRAIDIKNSTTSIKTSLAKRKKTITIVVIVLILLVAGYFAIKRFTKPSFQSMIDHVIQEHADLEVKGIKVYQEILAGKGVANEGCAVKIGENGKWLKLDTNPKDKDDDERESITYFYYEVSNTLIEYINSQLGFSDLVLDDMNETTWSMGVQTRESSKATVKWTYHPDKGLEVTYTLK